jgi:hypothetical protein
MSIGALLKAEIARARLGPNPGALIADAAVRKAALQVIEAFESEPDAPRNLAAFVRVLGQMHQGAPKREAVRRFCEDYAETDPLAQRLAKLLGR